MEMQRNSKSVDDMIMANCRLIAERVEKERILDGQYRKIYKCKDCDKAYDTFQALGGHRASHKKVRLDTGDGSALSPGTPPKMHECKICGMEFPIGQALGGHMRRHKGVKVAEDDGSLSAVSSEGNGKGSEEVKEFPEQVLPLDFLAAVAAKSVPESGKSNRKRIFGFDLNLSVDDEDEDEDDFEDRNLLTKKFF